MLTIRREQLAAFEESANEQFVSSLLAYVRRFHPDAVACEGESAARDAIRAGIARAASYGFVQRRHVCLYIDVLFTCGADFDVRLPWAAEILADGTTSAAERIEALFERADD